MVHSFDNQMVSAPDPKIHKVGASEAHLVLDRSRVAESAPTAVNGVQRLRKCVQLPSVSVATGDRCEISDLLYRHIRILVEAP